MSTLFIIVYTVQEEVSLDHKQNLDVTFLIWAYREGFTRLGEGSIRDFREGSSKLRVGSIKESIFHTLNYFAEFVKKLYSL